jgi:hypothetical protein
MATFPSLKTGAVAQYPLKTAFNYQADIVWFLDGSEQRFRNSPSVLHQWEIDLAKLDETELAVIEQFFLGNQGPTLSFSFQDPETNDVYPSCSVSPTELALTFSGPLSGSTTILIRENRT